MIQKSNFHKRDLDRILEAMRKAGLQVARVEVERGKLVVYAGRPDETPKAINTSEWDGATMYGPPKAKNPSKRRPWRPALVERTRGRT